MRKSIKFLILLFVLLFTFSVKAKSYTKEEYKELGVKRAYILCDYVFDMDNGFNPTLKDFLLASQTCPIDNVTLYDIMFTTDINGRAQETFTELLNNRKTSTFPNMNIKYVYNKSIGSTADRILDNTPTNIEYDLDTTPFDKTKFKNLNIKRSYIVGAYIFKIDGDFNPTLKDILLANQSNPKGQVPIYEISFTEDIDGNETERFIDLITGRELNSFPNLNLRYYFWGNILPNSHSTEKKQDLMTGDEITYTLGTYTYNGQQPNIKTATSKSNLPITYKVYPNTSCSGNEVEEYKNAGTYSVLATTEGNGTYAKASKCVSFIINKKAYNTNGFTITLDENVFNYDGEPKTPDVTVLEGTQELVKGRDYTVAYSNNVNIGNGAATVTFIGNYSGSKIEYFTISDKEIIIRKNNKVYTYDGLAKVIDLTISSPQNVTIVYGDSECDEELNNCTIEEKPSFTNAGTYDVYYMATAPGYNTNKGTVQVKINKAPDVITCEEKNNLVYNGEPQSINDPTSLSSIDNVVYYDAANCVNVNNGNGSCSGPSSPNAPTNQGNYVAVITSTGNDNYEVGTRYVRHNIAKKDGALTAVTLDNNVVTYTGNAIEPAVTVHDNERDVDLVAGTDYDVAYSDNVNTSTTSNKAKATVTYKGNYSGSQIAEFTITNASMTIRITSVTVTYDGQPHSITVTAPNDATIQYSPNNKNSYSSTNPSYTDVGTYTVWVKIEKSGFETIEQSATVVITQAQDIVSIPTDSKEYDGKQFPANADAVTTTSGANVYFEYYNSENCGGSGNNYSCSNPLIGPPTNVGNYMVKVISNRNNEKPNYSSGYVYASHNITPKSGVSGNITRELVTSEYNYDGNPKTPDVNIVDNDIHSTLVKNVDYTVTYENNTNASNNGSTAGNPTVTVDFIGNYSGRWSSPFVIKAIRFNETTTTVGVTNNQVNGTKVRVYVNKDIQGVTVKFGDTYNNYTYTATRNEPDPNNPEHINDAYYESEVVTTCDANNVYYQITSSTNNYLASKPTTPIAASVHCQLMHFQNQLSLTPTTNGYKPEVVVLTSTDNPIPTAERTVTFSDFVDSTTSCTASTPYISSEASFVPRKTSYSVCVKVEKQGYTTIYGLIPNVPAMD